MLNGGRQTHVALADPLDGDEVGAGEVGGAVKAPMHGRLIALAVEDGQTVEAGQRLAVVEAMKMEHALTAPRAGPRQARRAEGRRYGRAGSGDSHSGGVTRSADSAAFAPLGKANAADFYPA